MCKLLKREISMAASVLDSLSENVYRYVKTQTIMGALLASSADFKSASLVVGPQPSQIALAPSKDPTVASGLGRLGASAKSEAQHLLQLENGAPVGEGGRPFVRANGDLTHKQLYADKVALKRLHEVANTTHDLVLQALEELARSPSLINDSVAVLVQQVEGVDSVVKRLSAVLRNLRSTEKLDAHMQKFLLVRSLPLSLDANTLVHLQFSL